MGKTRENQQRHTMAQIASLLAVATVFIGLWTLILTFYSQGEGFNIHETELKLQGGRGLMREGSVFAGFCGIIVVHYLHNVKCNDLL